MTCRSSVPRLLASSESLLSWYSWRHRPIWWAFEEQQIGKGTERNKTKWKPCITYLVLVDNVASNTVSETFKKHPFALNPYTPLYFLIHYINPFLVFIWIIASHTLHISEENPLLKSSCWLLAVWKYWEWSRTWPQTNLGMGLIAEGGAKVHHCTDLIWKSLGTKITYLLFHLWS